MRHRCRLRRAAEPGTGTTSRAWSEIRRQGLREAVQPL
jgi:hypothetical protein